MSFQVLTFQAFLLVCETYVSVSVTAILSDLYEPIELGDWHIPDLEEEDREKIFWALWKPKFEI